VKSKLDDSRHGVEDFDITFPISND